MQHHNIGLCTVIGVGTAKQAKRDTLETVLLREQLKRGFNQTQAAQTIGVSRAVYSRWISGRAVLPSIQNLGAVAAYLGIDQRHLLDLFPDSYSLRGARGSSTRQIAELADEVTELRRTVDQLVTLVRERLTPGK